MEDGIDNVDWSDLLIDAMHRLLCVPALARCALTSKSWRAASEDDKIWLELCRRRWSTKVQRYHLDLPGRKAALLKQGLTWKQQYQRHEELGAIAHITAEELSAHRFDFTFRAQPCRRASTQFLFKADEVDYRNGRRISYVVGHPMQISYEWEILDQGLRVSLGPYPAASVFRREDWGWVVTNCNVVLCSLGIEADLQAGISVAEDIDVRSGGESAYALHPHFFEMTLDELNLVGEPLFTRQEVEEEVRRLSAPYPNEDGGAEATEVATEAADSFMDDGDEFWAVASRDVLNDSDSAEDELDGHGFWGAMDDPPQAESDAAVVVRDVQVAGHTVAIRELRHEGVLSDVYCSTGGEVWEAAHILAALLGASPGVLEGQRVLELGAGLGLLGFYAARAGAASVTLSDHAPELLQNLRQSVECNAARHGPWCGRAPAVEKLDWREWAMERGPPPRAAPACDVILGSELCYTQEHRVLADVLARLLPRHQPEGPTAPRATVPLRLPRPAAVVVQRSDRLGWEPFLARCDELGLHVDLAPVTGLQEGLSHAVEWDPAYVLCVVSP